MELCDLLKADSVIADFKASSKKQAIQSLSRYLADQLGLDPRKVFERTLEREKLGSTGVGRGVAIPHARIEGIDSVKGLFVRLNTPIEFDSVDGRPVDLMFMLLAPIEAGADHLKALAKVSRTLRDEKTCEKLRATDDSSALFAMLAGPTAAAA